MRRYIPVMRLSLYAIIGPDGIECSLNAAGPLLALRKFHAEACGERAVRIRDGQLRFKRREDQRVCAGTWTVTAQGNNASAAPLVVDIPPPDLP